MSVPDVIVPPAALVSAADAKAVGVFASDDGDTYVNTLLVVAQSQIDGPTGWLGRAIGLQTLQLTVPLNCVIDTGRLMLPPYVDTVSDIVSTDGRTRAFRWRAGYGTAPAKPLPPAIKHAIILMAGVLRDATPEEAGVLKRSHVEGVGINEYAVPGDAAAGMQKAVQSLLAPFKVYRL